MKETYNKYDRILGGYLWDRTHLRVLCAGERCLRCKLAQILFRIVTGKRAAIFDLDVWAAMMGIRS